MSLPYRALILTLLLTAAPLAYSDCEADLAAGLTIDRATEIVGRDEARHQVRRALLHVLREPVATRARDLDTLFQAIRVANSFMWNFRRFEGVDGSTGFMGELGFFVLVRPDGRLFKGELDEVKHFDRRGRWTGETYTIWEVEAL